MISIFCETKHDQHILLHGVDKHTHTMENKTGSVFLMFGFHPYAPT